MGFLAPVGSWGSLSHFIALFTRCYTDHPRWLVQEFWTINSSSSTIFYHSENCHGKWKKIHYMIWRCISFFEDGEFSIAMLVFWEWPKESTMWVHFWIDLLLHSARWQPPMVERFGWGPHRSQVEIPTVTKKSGWLQRLKKNTSKLVLFPKIPWKVLTKLYQQKSNIKHLKIT